MLQSHQKLIRKGRQKSSLARSNNPSGCQHLTENLLYRQLQQELPQNEMKVVPGVQQTQMNACFNRPLAQMLSCACWRSRNAAVTFDLQKSAGAEVRASSSTKSHTVMVQSQFSPQQVRCL